MQVKHSHRVSRCLAMLISVLIFTGCVGKGGTMISLRINEQMAPPSSSTRSQQVYLANEAEDAHPGRPNIGEATWTLFFFHVDGIQANSPITTQMTALAKQAFEKAGYQVHPVAARDMSSSGRPVVHVRVDTFWYDMWSYPWPFVPISGRTVVTVSIKDPDSRELYARQFQGKGWEACWFGSCADEVESAVAESLTGIMNQISQWASEEAFRKVVMANGAQQHRAGP